MITIIIYKYIYFPCIYNINEIRIVSLNTSILSYAYYFSLPKPSLHQANAIRCTIEKIAAAGSCFTFVPKQCQEH